MLKQAIDAYNFVLDIVDFIKKPSLKTKSFIFGAAALVAVAGSLLSVQAIGGGGGLSGAPNDKQTLSMGQQSSNLQPKANQSDDEKPETQAQTNNVASPGGGEASDKKNTTSAQDPVASKSFRLPVTKDSKYEIGTLVAYDAVKEDKTYYAGALVLSDDSITISKSGASATANNVTISAPDNLAISVPAEPTDDNVPNIKISLDASTPSETDKSYYMVVEVSEQVEVGTYVLHVAANRSGQSTSAGSWWYHGFLTVNVIE